MRSLVLLLLGAVLQSSLTVLAVKPEDFRKCDQASFCRRLKGISNKQAAQPTKFRSPYSLGAPVLADSAASASWTFPLSSALYPEIKFELRVDVLAQGDGIVRIRADEVGSQTPFKRYNETAKWVLLDTEPALASTSAARRRTSSGLTTITYGPPAQAMSLEIQHSPFKITQLRGGKPEIVFNDRSLFHMEHFRTKAAPEAATPPAVEGADGEQQQQAVFQAGAGTEPDRSWFEHEDGDGFEERWSKWTDSKPKGPEGLSIDLTFPGVDHIYGLPEHASPLSLPDTVGDNAHYSEPYRLYNVDIFEYLADSPMSLYGAIPLLHAHAADHSVGVLNLIASDTYVDVHHASGGTRTHWMSESGVLDLLLLPGPRPQHLFEQYAVLTGPTPLPPQWSTAYHQCRWNYVDEQDVLTVDRRFDEADIPLDVTWLDIEYAEEHRYFDWDHKVFPDPVRMQDAVAAKGRKMVAIVDPHIKKTDSFRIYTDARDADILIKRHEGSNFEGWCWTGSSVWVDFFNPKSWDWWTKMFSFGVWKESTPNLFIWNDMNEPSVFDGPEISVPRDSVHHGGWENRDVHNLNGMMFHNQTSQALIKREEEPKRPFVLSRSFFAGSQRYGAIWTGDNMGTWEHLAGQTAMILSNNIAGMSFCGADTGGFFGNPTQELLVRWYQAGAFAPFFRAHAHIDTKRREPYLYDEPIRGYIRDIIRLRYQLLSVWYNAFHDASVSGSPIVRPQYATFPEDTQGFAIDNQYYLGREGLITKPVTAPGVDRSTVYLSDNQPYYDYFTHHMHPATGKFREVTISTPLSTFPLLIQGGSILPIRQRVRRSSPLMWQDPYTLIVALDRTGKASGQLYSDDGVGYGYERGEFAWKKFRFEGGMLRSEDMLPRPEMGVTEVNKWKAAVAHVTVEQVVVLGVASRPTRVTAGGKSVEWTYEPGVSHSARSEGGAAKLIIKNPGVVAVDDWEIVIA